MKKVFLLVPLIFLLTACSHDQKQESVPSQNNEASQEAVKGTIAMTLTRIEKSEPTEKKVVTVEMEKGQKFALTLYPDLAPKTVANFLSKVSSGHYNGLTFHRVEPNNTGQTWVVQGGDPDGNGTGGGEIAAEYNNRTFKIGSLGIARGGDENINNDSQFFITTQNSSFLDKNYTNFGDVTSGMDQVRQIQVSDKIKTITAQ